MVDPKVLLIGHVSEDIRDNKTFPGGPPQYQIPILKAFNINLVDILTSFKDLPKILKSSGYRILNIPATETTTFQFEHSDKEGQDDRVLALKHKASDLTTADLNMLDQNYDIIIISAIANEASVELVNLLINKFPNSQIYIDGQSFTREISIDGLISNHFITQDLLRQLDHEKVVIKSSFYEINNLESYEFSGTLIRTNSGKPIQILHNGRYLTIELNEITQNIIDSTGSGDIFLASLAVLLNSDNNLIESVQLAHKITRDHLFIQGVPTVSDTKSIIGKYIHS